MGATKFVRVADIERERNVLMNNCDE